MSNMDKTGSIRLRAIEPEDLSLLKQWRNELKDFYREYRFINQPHQERWYETTIGDVRYVYYAIDVWDGKWCLVGSCGWCWIDWLNRHCDLSIYIGDFKWRNRGLGLKAMIQLHEIAFHEWNMHTVRLEVLSFNPAVEFYLKFGYKEVGRWRSAHWHDCEFHDSVLMDMTAAEWRAEWNDRYSQMRVEVPNR